MSDDIRTGLSADVLARAVEDHLFYLTGRHPRTASVNDVYLAVAHAVRDRLFAKVADTIDAFPSEATAKRVAYLSAEFLMGPQLGANLLNLGIVRPMRDALRRPRPRPRRSCSSRRKSRASATAASAGWPPATSIRWRRWQCRPSATASATSSASSIRRSATGGRSRSRTSGCAGATRGRSRDRSSPSRSGFGGRTEREPTTDGRLPRPLGARPTWCTGVAVRHAGPRLPRGDTATRCGCGAPRRSRRSTSTAFNVGDYFGAVDDKVRSETISKVLYPERRARRRARRCGCSSSTSSSRARCRTCCACTCSGSHAARRLPRAAGRSS